MILHLTQTGLSLSLSHSKHAGPSVVLTEMRDAGAEKTEKELIIRVNRDFMV